MGSIANLLGNEHEVVVCGCLGLTDALTKSTELDFGMVYGKCGHDSTFRFINAHSPIQPSHPCGGGITDFVDSRSRMQCEPTALPTKNSWFARTRMLRSMKEIKPDLMEE